MNKEQATKLWEQIYGGKEEAYDFSSARLLKDDFEKEGCDTGWTVDRKQESGPFTPDNVIIASLSSVRIRNKRNSFRIGNRLYEIRKGKKYKTYSLYDVTDSKNPICVDPSEENQTPEYNRNRLENDTLEAIDRTVEKPDLDSPLERSSILTAGIFNGRKNEEEEKIEEEIVSEENVQTEESCLSETESEEGTQPEEYIENEKNAEETTEETPARDEEVYEVVEEHVSESVEPADEPVYEEPVSESVISDEVSEEKECEERTDAERYIDEMIAVSDTPEDESESEEYTEESLSDSEDEYLDEEDGDAYGSWEGDQEFEPGYDYPEEQSDEEPLTEEEISESKEEPVWEETVSEETSEPESEETVEQEPAPEETVEEHAESEEPSEEIHESEEEEIPRENSETEPEFEEENVSDENTEVIEKELSEQIPTGDEVSEQPEEANELAEEETAKETPADDQGVYEPVEEEPIAKNAEPSEEEPSDSEEEISDGQNAYVAELLERIAELESQIEELNSENESLRDGFVVNDSQNADRINQLEFALSDLEEERDTLKAENENASLQAEQYESTIAELKAEIENLKQENETFAADKEKAEQDCSEANLRLSESNDGIAALNAEINQKEEEIASLKAEIEKINGENAEASEEKNRLEQEVETLKADIEDKDNEYNEEKSAQDEETNNLNARIAELVAETEELNKQINDSYVMHGEEVINLNSKINELEAENKQLNDQIAESEEAHEKAIKDVKDRYLWKSCKGKDEQYAAVKADFATCRYIFNAANIKLYASQHPECFDIPVGAEEKEKETEEAKKTFLDQYKKTMATDFAGRIIHIDNFDDRESDYGWGIVRRQSGLTIVANLKSIDDIVYDEPFKTNGHSYQVVKTVNGYKIIGVETVADPLDVDLTIEAVKKNTDMNEPLVWIGIKIVSAKGGAVSKNCEDADLFIEIVDQTARKSCRQSFVEIHKEVSISGPSLLLTFDGTNEEVYKEVSTYLVLLNSYRSRMKENGVIDAIIVSGEINAPGSARHLSFEQLRNKTKDVGLQIYNKEVLSMMNVNPNVTRSIHVGESIIDKLGLDKQLVNDSRLGKSDYASVYRWTYKYYDYNAVYNDERQVVEADN